MASMDESVLSNLVGENMPISSFLQSMGVKVKKQNYGVRLKAALESFDECYTDTMDFLTQILPMAKQHFGNHDALLLPKTPSKSRSRKYKEKLNDINKKQLESMSVEDKENTQSNTLTKLDSRSPKQQEKKIVTRNSTKAVGNERTSNSKEKFSNESAASDKLHVAFSPNILKRSVSAPVSTPSLKHSPKRSKSANNVCMDIEKVVEEQLSEQKLDSCPDVLSERNGEPCRKSVERKSGMVVVENIDNDMVEHKSVERVKNDLGRIESEEDTDMETNQVKTKSEKEEEYADMETNRETIENEEKEDVGMETSLCVEEEPMLCSTEAETCENEHEETNEQKQELHVKKSESRVVASMGDNANNCNSTAVGQTESPSECLVQERVHIVEIDDSHERKDLLAHNSEDITEIATESEEVSAKETTQEIGECSKSDAKAAPDIVPWVRRSRRSSRRISRISVDKQSKRRSSQRLSSRASRLSSCLYKTPPVNVPPEGKISSGESSSDFKLSMIMATFSEHFSIESEEKPQVKGVGPSSSTPDLQTENKPKGSLRSSTKISLKTVDHGRNSKSSSSDDVVGPSSSTPDLQTENKPKRSLRSSTKISLKTDHGRNSKSSSSDDNVGKVAEIVKKMNRNTNMLEEQTSVVKTPNGHRKIKRLVSTNKGSTKKPSNIVVGNFTSLIRRPSTKKFDADEIIRKSKEQQVQDRKKQAELRRKCVVEARVEEKKREWDEKLIKVAKTKAAREKDVEERKQRQVEEDMLLLQAFEQAKKRKEQEEKTKKELREQRKRDADARRLKENERKMKRFGEKEEEDRLCREILKRRQEHDEQGREERVREENRVQEQRRRDRQREQQEDRDRKLRDIKEKDIKETLEKENYSEARALAEKKNREEKARKQMEQDDREKKRIAQLIKKKMEQDKKIWEEKREKEENARIAREQQKKLREANKVNASSASALNKSALNKSALNKSALNKSALNKSALNKSALNKSALNKSVKPADSYPMTPPPPARTRKPPTDDNYDISDIRSDDSTDDGDSPRKKVPTWAQGATLKAALLNQNEPRGTFEADVGPYNPPDLDKIFRKKRKRFYHRTSSAQWYSPALKKDQSFNISANKIEL